MSGAKVTVIERAACCSEASWAGGGIVSPLYPWRYSAAVTALACQAQAIYPALCAALLGETGIDPEHAETGLLMLDSEDAPDALLWASRVGKPIQELHASSLYEQESELAQGFRSALWMPDIANIRNPRLGRALTLSLRRNPCVTLMEQTQLLGLDCARVKGVREVRAMWVEEAGIQRRLPASHVIVAAGAWSGLLLQQAGVAVPVSPVKGQMLLYEPPRRLLHSIVLHAGRYLIPRRDRHILVGSTLEHVDFDKSTTEQAREDLRASAIAMLPALADLPIKQQWAGLRPGAPKGLPQIGRLSEWRNLSVNSGHFRNGLVLAPASARLLADSLLGRRPLLDPAPYVPGVAA
jgi:glycine oxidase